jgi:hypothetical protein
MTLSLSLSLSLTLTIPLPYIYTYIQTYMHTGLSTVLVNFALFCLSSASVLGGHNAYVLRRVALVFLLYSAPSSLPLSPALCLSIPRSTFYRVNWLHQLDIFKTSQAALSVLLLKFAYFSSTKVQILTQKRQCAAVVSTKNMTEEAEATKETALQRGRTTCLPKGGVTLRVGGELDPPQGANHECIKMQAETEEKLHSQQCIVEQTREEEGERIAEVWICKAKVA